MAAEASLSDKKRLSYDLLHNLSSVDILFHEKKKKRRNVSKSFLVMSQDVRHFGKCS